MEKKNCKHCGDDCGSNPVVWQDNNFCCNGCQTVYEILSSHKLYSYYQIEKSPGIKVENTYVGNKYAYLDQKEIADKLLIFSEGNIKKIQFYIPSIHCSSCIWLLENLHKINEGIIQSTVNFIKKEVTITFNSDKISLRNLVELLVSIHYIPDISLKDSEKKRQKTNNRKLIFKLGIAGFAFGNIMLLTIPEYVTGAEFLEHSFKQFFGYIVFILALPILVYSSNDYIISAFKNLKKGILNIDFPISLGIIALFSYSSVEIFSGHGNGYMDSFAGLIFFLLIGKWFQNKSYQALSFDRDYKSYFPIAVTVLDDGFEKSVTLDKLKKGDVILIRNNELIPADSILKSGAAHIDYSFVTGETLPVSKSAGEIIYAGGKQIGESLELVVENDVEQSYLTQLWNEKFFSGEKKVRLNKIVDIVGKYFSYITISIALITLIFWLIYLPEKAIYAFTSVLIVVCPCALSMSLPFTFGNAIRSLGKKGVYLKSVEVIEVLSKVTDIVFDKTGTITHKNDSEVEFAGENLSDSDLAIIKSLVRHSTHTLSTIIYNNIKESKIYSVSDFEEIAGKGILGNVNNLKIAVGSEEFVAKTISDDNNMSTKVYISFDNVVKGYFKISNKYRNNLSSITNELTKKYSLHLLSGDNDSEKENIKQHLPNNSNIYFNQSPHEKLEYLKSLNSSDKTTLMVGDGLNDAGALNESHVGISVSDNVYSFSPSCDAILDAQSFDYLPNLLMYSKQCVNIVIISFVISFLYNIVGLYYAVQGELSPVFAAILMPLSSISVVLFATVFSRLFSSVKM